MRWARGRVDRVAALARNDPSFSLACVILANVITFAILPAADAAFPPPRIPLITRPLVQYRRGAASLVATLRGAIVGTLSGCGSGPNVRRTKFALFSGGVQPP